MLFNKKVTDLSSCIISNIYVEKAKGVCGRNWPVFVFPKAFSQRPRFYSFVFAFLTAVFAFNFSVFIVNVTVLYVSVMSRSISTKGHESLLSGVTVNSLN